MSSKQFIAVEAALRDLRKFPKDQEHRLFITLISEEVEKRHKDKQTGYGSRETTKQRLNDILVMNKDY